jgi:hypothetical protein
LLLHFPLLFKSNSDLFQWEDLQIFNFLRACGWYYIALALSPPSITKAAVSKNAQGCCTYRSNCSR